MTTAGMGFVILIAFFSVVNVILSQNCPPFNASDQEKEVLRKAAMRHMNQVQPSGHPYIKSTIVDAEELPVPTAIYQMTLTVEPECLSRQCRFPKELCTLKIQDHIIGTPEVLSHSAICNGRPTPYTYNAYDDDLGPYRRKNEFFSQ